MQCNPCFPILIRKTGKNLRNIIHIIGHSLGSYSSLTPEGKSRNPVWERLDRSLLLTLPNHNFMDQIFTNEPQRRMQNLIGTSLLCGTTTLKPREILVREHVGEMFSYLSQENWNESKKHSHNWTQSRILLLAHTRRQIKKSRMGKIGRITTLDPA